jgi:hypothetical protein
MKAAIVAQWRGAKLGREAQALQYQQESEEFFGELAQQGKCTKPTWFMSMDGSMIWFVAGEFGDLMEIEMSEGGQRQLAKGQLLLDDFQTGIYFTEDVINQMTATYERVGSELGITSAS